MDLKKILGILKSTLTSNGIKITPLSIIGKKVCLIGDWKGGRHDDEENSIVVISTVTAITAGSATNLASLTKDEIIFSELSLANGGVLRLDTEKKGYYEYLGPESQSADQLVYTVRAYFTD